MIDSPPFEPHPLLRTPWPMTAACLLPRRGSRRLRKQHERRLFRVDDATRVAVDLDRPSTSPRAAILLVHGMVGSSSSSYVIGTAAKAVARGFLAARLNVRNCGDTEELAGSVYNGGLTEDIEAVAAELAREVERVHLVGFSLGGNMVLKLAAEWGANAPDRIASVTAVSPSIDLARSSEALNHGVFPRLLQRGFMRDLEVQLRRRHRLDGGAYSLDGIDRVRTVREFDELFTAPLAGFRDVDDYYERASARPLLDRIELPVLVVTAQDDPLVPFDVFRDMALAANPAISLLAPARGGHVAFFAREPAKNGVWTDRDRFWAENRAVQFAAAHEPG